MNKIVAVFVFILLVFVCSLSAGYADIIRLKRGVSFEGKIIESSSEEYVVEMSVGVVSFQKREVDSIEYFSDMQNNQMVEEWFPQQEYAKNVTTDTLENVPNTVDIGDPVKAADQMVRYKGRYITPEVYEIIKREKEVKNRRYKFIQDQKIKKEKKELYQQQRVVDNTVADSSQTQYVDAQKEEGFGTRRSQSYGAESNNSDDSQSLFDDHRYKSMEDVTKPYSSAAGHDSI